MDFIKLKKKDIDIINLLDSNSRVSLREISNHLKISKQACKRKIHELEKKGVIKKIPLINYFNLDYKNVHIYFKLFGTENISYKKIINELVKIKNVAWVSTFFGDLNLGLSVFYSSFNELSDILKKVYSLLGENIIKEEKHFVLQQFVGHFSIYNKHPQKMVEISPAKEKKSLSELDKKIFNLVHDNANFTYLDIAENIGTKAETVKRHLKKLEREEIILKYKLLIDYNKIGYIWSLLHLSLNKNKKRENLLKTLKAEKRVPFISETIEGDMIVDFVSNNYIELKNFIETLKSKNKEINDYRILNIHNIHKIKEPST